MLDNIVRFEGGEDWYQFHIYTDHEWVAAAIIVLLLLAILLTSTLCYYLTRWIMLMIVNRLARRDENKWLRAAERHKVFHRLAPLVPAAIVYASAPLLTGITFPFVAALGRPLAIFAACYMVVTLVRAAIAFRDSIEERYSHVPSSSERPIKSFLQISTIIVYLIALIAVISILLERSPVYMLTGLSAVTALLIIVFRDSLLGCVASIQLAAYDMLRVGDWIEVPGYVADGEVIDIALNTIKVRNFDNTVIMLPSYVLLTNSVKNWRGMTESGGRRVKHAIHFDADTIRFPDETLMARLHGDARHPLALLGDEDLRHNTNLGLFRHYITAYLRTQDSVRRDMALIVRQVQTSRPMIALEIYFYLDETDWTRYERKLSDLIDHAYGVVPIFGLRVWQKEKSKAVE